MLIRRPRLLGFTVVELMIALGIISMLFLFGMPSFTSWVRNNQVRTAADSLQNGLRMAQNEAVRRNRRVVLILTNDTPGPMATAMDNGRSWAISTEELVAGSGEGRDYIDGGPLSDVTGDLRINGPGTICFSSAGRLIASEAAVFGGQPCVTNAATPTTTYAVGRPSPKPGDRMLNVTVTLGGQVRMCNPLRVATESPDGC